MQSAYTRSRRYQSDLRQPALPKPAGCWHKLQSHLQSSGKTMHKIDVVPDEFTPRVCEAKRYSAGLVTEPQDSAPADPIEKRFSGIERSWVRLADVKHIRPTGASSSCIWEMTCSRV